MSTETIDTASVHLTEEGILLFPQVFEPKKVKKRGRDGKMVETGDPIFSASLILSPENVKTTWAAAVKHAREFFGADVKVHGEGAIRMPIVSGAVAKAEADTKGKDGSFYDGKFVLRARSLFMPGLLDVRTRQEIKKGTTAAGLVRSGNYAVFEVKFQGYEGVDGGRPGVKAYLNHILITREGKPIAGKTVADAFAGVMSKYANVAVDVPEEGHPALDDTIPY